jgi:hypothetical protein
MNISSQLVLFTELMTAGTNGGTYVCMQAQTLNLAVVSPSDISAGPTQYFCQYFHWSTQPEPLI